MKDERQREKEYNENRTKEADNVEEQNDNNKY